MALSATVAAANAAPTENNWKGKGAMARWSTPVPVEAIFAEQMIDGTGAIQSNILYIKSVYNGIVDESFYALSDDEFYWDTDRLHIYISDVDLSWCTYLEIDWDTYWTPQETVNYFMDGAVRVDITGKFKAANAFLSIDRTYDSNWAITGVQPTINSCDSLGNIQTIFNAGANVHVKGSYYDQTKCTLYVVNDVVTWIDDTVIATLSPINTVPNVDITSGNIPITSVYPDAAPGLYDIIVDLNNNGKYEVDKDVLCNNVVMTTAGFFVVPEYCLGGLLAMAACFAAFIIIKKPHLNLKLKK